MKKIGLISSFMVVLVTLIMGCNINSETNETQFDGSDTLKIIKTLDNQRGFIAYDSINDLFSIRVPKEGTIDELEVGIITNMVNDFKKEVMDFDYSKGTIGVVFSGKFFELNNDSFGGPVGTTYYYLKLSHLKIINKSIG
jgi:hypothetical protein